MLDKLILTESIILLLIDQIFDKIIDEVGRNS
jgi:hypothetical protein